MIRVNSRDQCRIRMKQRVDAGFNIKIDRRADRPQIGIGPLARKLNDSIQNRIRTRGLKVIPKKGALHTIASSNPTLLYPIIQ